MNIGTIIHNNPQWETRAYIICTSGCALIWLAGHYRYLSRKTFLGFHSAAKISDPNVRYEAGNQQVARYLKSLDVPRSVIELFPQADPKDMKFIDYERAQSLGLIRERHKQLDEE